MVRIIGPLAWGDEPSSKEHVWAGVWHVHIGKVDLM